MIDGVRSGRLSAGARLPTVRELARELGLAVNTVARAYREMEVAGIVETRGRFGTFVSRVDPADAAMAAAARSFAEVTRALGVSKSEALRYVEQELG
jgi:DNA-binding transcriptional regulator YhcF (GntR family)